MKEVMIDLETWGTSPDCVIRAICLAIFDPRGAASHDRYTLCDLRATLDQQLENGRAVEAQTVEWWRRQSVLLSEYLTAYENEDPAVTKIIANDFHESMIRLDHQIRAVNNGNGPAAIWSRGYFDIGILQPMMGNTLPYYKIRDVRTLDSFVPRVQSANPHDPVCDCEAQVAQVRSAYTMAHTALVAKAAKAAAA